MLPRREPAEAAGSAELRRALTPAGLPGDRPRQEERDRFLFAAALARVDEHLVLVRRAADDDGLELAPSPFWDEVVRVLGDAAPGRRRRLPRTRSTATTSASGCRPSPRSRATTRRRPWRARAPTAGARSRASSARWRPGGARPACATARCSRASPASRRTPSPSSRRSRPARRSGSWSASCTRATSSSRSTQRISGSVMHNALRLFFNGVAVRAARRRGCARSTCLRRSTCSTAASTRRSRCRPTRTTTSPGRRCGASCGATCARSCAARRTARRVRPAALRDLAAHRAACASATCRSRAASTASTSASGSPRR